MNAEYLIPQTKIFYPMSDKGCNIRSLQAMAELKLNRLLQIPEIEDLYTMNENMGYVGGYYNKNKVWVKEPCYVNKPENVANSVFKHFKSNTRAWNCGIVKNGEAVNWKGHPTVFDYSIIKLWQPNMKDKHFVLGDKDFNLVFDPYPNSASVKSWNVKDIYLYSFYEA